MPSAGHVTEHNQKSEKDLFHTVISMLVKQIRKTLVLNFKRTLSGCILLQMCLIKYIKIELVAIVKQDRVKLISVLRKRKLKIFKNICISIAV